MSEHEHEGIEPLFELDWTLRQVAAHFRILADGDESLELELWLIVIFGYHLSRIPGEHRIMALAELRPSLAKLVRQIRTVFDGLRDDLSSNDATGEGCVLCGSYANLTHVEFRPGPDTTLKPAAYAICPLHRHGPATLSLVELELEKRQR